MGETRPTLKVLTPMIVLISQNRVAEKNDWWSFGAGFQWNRSISSKNLGAQMLRKSLINCQNKFINSRGCSVYTCRELELQFIIMNHNRNAWEFYSNWTKSYACSLPLTYFLKAKKYASGVLRLNFQCVWQEAGRRSFSQQWRDTTRMPEKLTQLRHHFYQRYSTRCHRLRAQSHKAHSLPPCFQQILIPSLGCHLRFWPTDYKVGLPNNLHLGFQTPASVQVFTYTSGSWL